MIIEQIRQAFVGAGGPPAPTSILEYIFAHQPAPSVILTFSGNFSKYKIRFLLWGYAETSQFNFHGAKAGTRGSGADGHGIETPRAHPGTKAAGRF